MVSTVGRRCLSVVDSFTKMHFAITIPFTSTYTKYDHEQRKSSHDPPPRAHDCHIAGSRIVSSSGHTNTVFFIFEGQLMFLINTDFTYAFPLFRSLSAI